MLEEILSQDLTTPKEAGVISSIATVIGFSLFFYTTGFQWIRDSIRSWRGDTNASIVNIDEITRKIALLIFIVNFNLITTAITSIVNYSKDAISDTQEAKTAATGRLIIAMDYYKAFNHYFKKLGDYQNERKMVKNAEAAKEKFYKSYPEGKARTFPANGGVMDALGIVFDYSVLSLWGGFKTGFALLFLYIGKFLGLIYMYFFTVIFQILLALVPLALAFSIPKSMENAYATIIRRLLNVGVAFLVLNLLDKFVLNAFNQIAAKVFLTIGGGDKAADFFDVSTIEDQLFFGVPVFCIALIGLYSSSIWIASAVTGGSDGEGGIATKGMGQAIGGMATIAGIALIGGKVATGGAGAGASALAKKGSNTKETKSE